MVGLLLLKQIENLSDERVVEAWTRNPYYQAFCGEEHFRWETPCDPSEPVYFRKRISEEGFEKIFKASVALHGKKALEKDVVIDTTSFGLSPFSGFSAITGGTMSDAVSSVKPAWAQALDQLDHYGIVRALLAGRRLCLRHGGRCKAGPERFSSQAKIDCRSARAGGIAAGSSASANGLTGFMLPSNRHCAVRRR